MPSRTDAPRCGPAWVPEPCFTEVELEQPQLEALKVEDLQPGWHLPEGTRPTGTFPVE